MPQKHKVIQLNPDVINRLCTHDEDHPNAGDFVCAAIFYKNGKIRLFSPNTAQELNEITTGVNAIRERCNQVAANAHGTGKSGLIVSKFNPWTFVYTIGGRTYEVTIHP